MSKALFAIKCIVTAAIIAAVCTIASNSLACCAVVRVHDDSRLNVRNGPGTEYRVSAGMANGAELHLISVQDGWALVAWPRYPDHPLGWVSTDYLSIKNGLSAGTHQTGNSLKSSI